MNYIHISNCKYIPKCACIKITKQYQNKQSNKAISEKKNIWQNEIYIA